MKTMTAKQVAKKFGCTEAQARALYAKNATALRECAAKTPTNGKYRGYTRADWAAFACRAEQQAG